MFKGIEHIGIYSNDTAALKNWYIEMFGFEQVYDNGKGTFFLKAPDGSMMEFVSAQSDGGVIGDKVSGIRHIALSVDNFEECYDMLMNAKVEVVSDAVISPNGLKIFFFRDLDGNVLHLIYRSSPL